MTIEHDALADIFNETAMHRHVRRDGSYDGYLAALQAAWDALAAQPVDSKTLTDAVCLAFIQGRLRGIAASLSRQVPLVMRAVALGLWTREYARSLANLMPSGETWDRFGKQALLAWLDRGSSESDDIDHHDTDQDGERLVFHHLFGGAPPETVLENILSSISGQESSEQHPEQDVVEPLSARDLASLSEVVPYLPEHALDRVLAVARHAEPGPSRADLLAALAVRAAVPVEEAFDAVYEALRSESSGRLGRLTLKQFCPLLSGTQLHSLFLAARRMTRRENGIELIVEIAPYLDADTRDQALNFAFGSFLMLPRADNNDLRGGIGYRRLLALLIPLLSGDLLRQGVELLMDESEVQQFDIGTSLNLLADSVPKLPQALRQSVLAYITEPALLTAHEQALTVLMRELPPDGRQHLLEMALSLPVEGQDTIRGRSHNPVAPKTLIRLIPHLDGTDRDRAVQAAYDMALTLADVGGGFEYIYSPIAEVMAELAPFLEGDHLHEAMRRGLHGAFSLPETHHMDSRPRDDAINALAAYLPADLLQPLLDRAARPRSIWDANLLKTLLQYVPADSQETRLEILIQQEVNQDRDPHDRGFWLAGLVEAIAPFLRGNVLAQALDITLHMSQSFGGSYSREQTLAALAPFLDSTLLHHALDQLTAMLPGSDEMPREPRKTAAESESRPAEGQLDQDARRELQRKYDSACAVLASYCHTPDLIARMTAAAKNVQDDWQRAQALGALVPHVMLDEQRVLVESVLDIISQMNPTTHTAFGWRKRSAPNPLLLVAPYLTGDLAQRASKIALATEHADTRVDLLLALLPYLNDDALRSTAIDTIFEASSVGRERSLAELMPQLTPGQRDDVLDRILSNPGEILMRRHLEGVAAHLTDAGLSRLLDEALGKWDAFNTYNLLEPVVSRLTRDNLRRVVEFLLAVPSDNDFGPPPERGIRARTMSSTPRDYYRGQLLAAVIPYLEPSMQVPVRAAIEQLTEPLGRALALAAFARHHLHDTSDKQTMLEAALQAAVQISHPGEQLKALAAFTWEPATAAAAVTLLDDTEDPLRRARLLAHLIPHAAEPQPLISAARSAVMTYLRSGGAAKPLCVDPLLCAPTIFSPAHLAQIAQMITEVYESWTWP